MYPDDTREMPLLTLAVANVNTGVPPSKTLSEPTTPTKEGVPVAAPARVPSYSLFTPVSPETVKLFRSTVIDVEAEDAAK